MNIDNKKHIPNQNNSSSEGVDAPINEDFRNTSKSENSDFLIDNMFNDALDIQSPDIDWMDAEQNDIVENEPEIIKSQDLPDTEKEILKEEKHLLWDNPEDDLINQNTSPEALEVVDKNVLLKDRKAMKEFLKKQKIKKQIDNINLIDKSVNNSQATNIKDARVDENEIKIEGAPPLSHDSAQKNILLDDFDIEDESMQAKSLGRDDIDDFSGKVSDDSDVTHKAPVKNYEVKSPLTEEAEEGVTNEVNNLDSQKNLKEKEFIKNDFNDNLQEEWSGLSHQETDNEVEWYGDLGEVSEVDEDGKKDATKLGREYNYESSSQEEKSPSPSLDETLEDSQVESNNTKPVLDLVDIKSAPESDLKNTVNLTGSADKEMDAFSLDEKNVKSFSKNAWRNKLNKVKKQTIIHLAILVISSITVVLSIVYFQNISKSRDKKFKDYSQELTEISKKIQSIEQRARVIGDYVELWENLPENKKNLEPIDLTTFKDALNLALKDNYLFNTTLNISKPVSLSGIFNKKTVSVQAVPVTISFESIVDGNIFTFIEDLRKDLPGYVVVESIDMVQAVDSINRNMLKDISKGNFPSIVTGNISMYWFKIDKKQ